MRITRFLLLAGLLGVPLPHASPPVRAAGEATHSLRVNVTKNGRPLPNWPVRIVSAGTQANAAPVVDATLTQPDGAITFRNLRPGPVTILAAPPWTGGGENSITKTVSIASGAHTQATVEIITGRVSGTARALGIPVPGARLTLTPQKPAKGRTLPFMDQFADSRGRLSLEAPPGRYAARLTFGETNYALWSGSLTVEADKTTLLPAEQPSSKKFSLLFGTVHKGGQPLRELYLTVREPPFNAYGPSLLRILTGPSGAFLMPVPIGSFTVEVTDFPLTPDPYRGSSTTVFAARNIHVKARNRIRLDFDLSDRILEGAVTVKGQPLEGATVQITHHRGGVGHIIDEEVRTDANGRYRLLAPLIRGRDRGQEVHFYSPAGQLIRSVPLSEHVTEKQLNVAWTPGTLSGVLKDKDGNPVPNFPLTFDRTGRIPPIRTAADGTFSFLAHPTTAQNQNELYGGGLRTWKYGPRGVPAGEVKMLSLTLNGFVSRIEGEVRLPGPDKNTPGNPIAGALVQVGNGAIGDSIFQTDAEGKFVVEAVPTGAYSIRVVSGRTDGIYNVRSHLRPLVQKNVMARSGQTYAVKLTVNAGWVEATVNVAGRDVVPEFLWVTRVGEAQSAFQLSPDKNGAFRALMPVGPHVVEYAPGPEVVVPGVSPKLASRIVQQVDVKPGARASVHLSVERLRPLWSVELGPDVRVHAEPVLIGDLALIASEDGYVTAVQASGPARREVLWRFPLGAPAQSRPLAAGNRLFVATTDGMLHALDIAAGLPQREAPGFPVSLSGAALLLQPVWSPGPNTKADPLSGDVLLSGAGPDPAVIRVDGRTGTIREGVPLPARPTTSPFVLGERLALGLEDGRTVALNPDGSLAWQRVHLAERVGVSGPLSRTSDGRLLQGTEAGTIEALDPDYGKSPKRWPNRPLFKKITGAFEGIRDEAVVSPDGLMLFAPAGDLGLISLITYNGQICPIWPWSAQDPFGLPTTTQYRYLASPETLVAADGKPYLYANAALIPVDGTARYVLDWPFVARNRSEYGVFLHIPLENPGNGYSVFYGDFTDRFAGSPVATGNRADDVVLAVTQTGRLYAFPVLAP